MLIYVGDGQDVIKRIKNNHLQGNVESSALRKQIAIAMGYEISTIKRSSGSTRVRIDLPDSKVGERCVSTYLRAGLWQYVICDSYEEANAFQWYAIEKLQPLLNKDRRAWNRSRLAKFETLLEGLQSSQFYQCSQLSSLSSEVGVYALHQQRVPMSG